MRHFVDYFNESVKKHWDLPALTNFGKETYTYGQLCQNIAKQHIIFKEAGLVKGDKIALYARNSAEWVIAYFSTLTYGAVTVPFLPDFNPAAVAELASFSECKLLIADDIAINGLKEDKSNFEKMETVKGFLGVVNVKTFNTEYSIDGKLANIVSNVEELYSSLYPSGLTADDVNYYNDSFG